MSAPKGIALNQGGLNTSVGYEYQRSVQTPPVTGVLRGTLPSYANSFIHTTQAESIVITVPVPAITGPDTKAVTASQHFQALFSVSLAASDMGQIVFTNVSVSPSNANYVVGHPTLLLQNGSGQNVNGARGAGVLSPGNSYQGLNIQVNTTVFSNVNAGAGSLTINATALLLGTISQGLQQQLQ